MDAMELLRHRRQDLIWKISATKDKLRYTQSQALTDDLKRMQATLSDVNNEIIKVEG